VDSGDGRLAAAYAPRHDRIRCVAEGQALDMLVAERELVVLAQVAGERRKARRRKERVLDRSEEGAEGYR
jgi:hypothetical protein